jgi:hypothetical protein
MKILINESQLINLSENVQLADKVYFNTGKLTPEDKHFIMNITRGDQTTKLISDIYFHYKDNWGFYNVKKNLYYIHRCILNYNKNVFPIKGFNIYNPSGESLYNIISDRQKNIDNLKNLPSIAIRNLRSDIRKERDVSEMNRYDDLFRYFLTNISYLDNRDEKTKNKILQKMYKSNVTMEDLARFTDEKENLIGGGDFDRKKIEEIIEQSDGDIIPIYDKNNVLVLEVLTADAIKLIGCNSLWCFTYGINNYQTWNNYSQYGFVYVIVNLNEEPNSQEFMWTLIKPLKEYYDDEDDGDSPLFNMGNDNYYNPYDVLNQIIGDDDLIHSIFNFGDDSDDEDDYDDENHYSGEQYEEDKETLKNIIRKYFKGSLTLNNDNVEIEINQRGNINRKDGTINITLYNKKTGKRNTGNIKVDKLVTYATNYQLFESKK